MRRDGGSRMRIAAILCAAPAAAAAGGGSPSGDEVSTWGVLERPEGLSMGLEAMEGGEGAPPILRATIRNDGIETVTLVLDPRLADLEFRAGRHRLACPTPDRVAPPQLAGMRSAAIPPGGAAWVGVDPTYHCWTRLDRFARRAAGMEALVTATYRVVLIDPATGGAAGRAGDLVGSTTIGVPTEVPWTGPPPPEADREAAFSVEGVAEDASDGGDLWLTLTVRNRTGAAVKLVDHPTQFRFDVAGPTGEWHCSMGPWRIEPIPDLFVRLRGRQKYVRRVEMSKYCSADVFAEPGIYRIEPTYDPYLAERAGEGVWGAPVRGAPIRVRIRRGDMR